MKKIIIFLFLSFGLVCPSWGSYEKDLIALIKNFEAAVVSKDKQAIKTAMVDLKKNEDVIAYMKENFPRQYRIYKLQDILARLDKVRKIYKDIEQRPIEGGAFSVSSPTAVGYAANGETAIKSANQYVSPNKVSRFEGSNSNGQYVQNYPNQLRESNQDSIQRQRP